jgi:hypothetical protein
MLWWILNLGLPLLAMVGIPAFCFFMEKKYGPYPGHRQCYNKAADDKNITGEK